MNNYLDFLNENFPIRKTKTEKGKFREYAVKECEEKGFSVQVEKLEGKHENVIIGDVKNAKVVFTAHYDTPAKCIYPNLMTPRNPIFGYAYALFFPLLMAFLSLVLAFGLEKVFKFGQYGAVIVYVIIYFSLFFLATRCFKNKRNFNDNTSGIATILELVSANAGKRVAFILFDNEEKGLLGSKAYAKTHKDLVENKLVINLDCVGNGNNILFIAKEGAQKLDCFKKLKSRVEKNAKYNLLFFPKKGSIGNSDYKNFNTGVGVMACSKSKLIGYYTSRIHTSLDFVANNENIIFLTNYLTKFVNSI